MRALVALLLLAGCDPDVPPGGFRCSADDQACPSGQHCSCGLCVAHDSEAACSFDVKLDQDPLTVKEHQPFHVTVGAKAPDGSPASGFRGTVDLSFALPDGTKWADVRPATLALSGGTATAMVTINRETIPPQSPRLTASFAGRSGASSGIHVLAPTIVKDPSPVTRVPFGWASQQVSTASVIYDLPSAQFRMYFSGADTRVRVGLALSPDGATFTPKPDPVFPGAGSLFPQTAVIISAAPFVTGAGWNLAFYAQDDMGNPLDIGLATSSDGLGTFALANGGNPILTRASCGSYCDQQTWFPTVTAAPTSGMDLGAPSWLMFFAAVRCNKPNGMCANGGYANSSMSIGRAESADGVTFQPEPAPVLSGDTGGEAYMATPQVLLDGSVYKMWYTFTRSLGVLGNPCDVAAKVQIGYATSSDGFFWVRSPSNPVVTVGGTSWDASAPGILIDSVVPADGKDPESGLFLYYSAFATLAFPPFCVPNTIGRATTQ